MSKKLKGPGKTTTAPQLPSKQTNPNTTPKSTRVAPKLPTKNPSK